MSCGGLGGEGGQGGLEMGCGQGPTWVQIFLEGEMVDHGSCVKHSGVTSGGTLLASLINWKGGAEVQGVLLFLGLEMLCCLPEVVVYVSWLESCELERMNSCIGFEGPW